MATSRKDFQGRVLRKGEIQRKSDKRYVYTFTDPFGKRKSIYATTLKALRMKEDELKKDQLCGRPSDSELCLRPLSFPQAKSQK